MKAREKNALMQKQFDMFQRIELIIYSGEPDRDKTAERDPEYEEFVRRHDAEFALFRQTKWYRRKQLVSNVGLTISLAFIAAYLAFVVYIFFIE